MNKPNTFSDVKDLVCAGLDYYICNQFLDSDQGIDFIYPNK